MHSYNRPDVSHPGSHVRWLCEIQIGIFRSVQFLSLVKIMIKIDQIILASILLNNFCFICKSFATSVIDYTYLFSMKLIFLSQISDFFFFFHWVFNRSLSYDCSILFFFPARFRDFRGSYWVLRPFCPGFPEPRTFSFFLHPFSIRWSIRLFYPCLNSFLYHS